MHPKTFDNAPFHSLLGLLWYYYTMYHPISEVPIEDAMEQLTSIITPLSQKRQRRIRHIVSSAFQQYQEEIFCAGIQAGAQLILELYKKTE